MVNLMEWQKQLQQNNVNVNVNVNVNNNGTHNSEYVKAMTDEQLETLRKQIAAYATICDQLVQMHTKLSAQHDLAGVRLGNLYSDPFITSGGHKITSRQRWTPTPLQLQILERIFDQGNGTPSKEKIKEITCELSQHGQISETNVYNWFQNRRARSKRKLQNLAPSNAESEVDNEVDSKDKKTKVDEFHSQQTTKNLCFQNPQVSSEMQYLNHEHDCNKPTGNFRTMPAFDDVLSSSRKMEIPGNYNLYYQAEDYNLRD